MPRTFRDFLAGYPTDGLLPLHLTHCTQAFDLAKIIESKSLTPRDCEVFKQDLLYFFYGRPAFKPSLGIAPNNIIDYAPVCLIVDPCVIERSARIFPFDSGGFDRYEPIIGNRLSLQDFAMDNDLISPSRLVKAYFSSNLDYYRGVPTPNTRFNALDSTAQAYGRLLADANIRSDDDRCGTIEVQIQSNVLLSESLRGIVAPSVVLDDPSVVDLMKECPEAIPFPYATYGRVRPDNYMYPIYSNVELFHRDKRAL